MFANFFLSGDLPAEAETGSFIFSLVFMSFLVVSTGAYTALSFMKNISSVELPKEKQLLHRLASVALGGGAWSMHFVGMLAYRTRIVIHYDPWLTLLSLIIPVLAAYYVLRTLNSDKLCKECLLTSSVVLGLAVCGMHYTAMSAMIMDAAIYYQPNLFFASVVIAVLGSGAAFWIVLKHSEDEPRKQLNYRVAAAVTLGLAVCAMHYVSMAGTIFVPYPNSHFDANQSFTVMTTSVLLSSFGLFALLTLSISKRLFRSLGYCTLFMAPCLLIIIDTMGTYNRTLDIDDKEKSGIYSYIKIVDILERLQTMRGISYRDSSNPESGVTHAAQLKEQLFVVLTDVDNLKKSTSMRPEIEIEYKNFRTNLEILETTCTSQSQANVFKLFTKVITLLYVFMDDAFDRSNLTANPTLERSYFEEAAFRDVPTLIQIIGSMQVMASGLLAEGLSPDKWTENNWQQLRALAYELRFEENNLRNAVEFISRGSVKSDVITDYYAQEVEPAASSLETALAESTLQKQSPELFREIFATSTQTMSAYNVLCNKIGNVLLVNAQDMHREHILKRNLMFLSSLAAFFGFFIVVIYLYRNLTKTEKAEATSKGATEKLNSHLIDFEKREAEMAMHTTKLENSRVEASESNQKYMDERTKMKSILDNTFDFIVTCDATGLIKSFNLAAVKAFGYSMAEVIGSNINILVSAPEHILPHGFFEQYIKSGESKDKEIPPEIFGVRKDGTTFPFALSVTWVHTTQSRLFIIVFRELTHQVSLLNDHIAPPQNIEAASVVADEAHIDTTPVAEITVEEPIQDTSLNPQIVAGNFENALQAVISELQPIYKNKNVEIRTVNTLGEVKVLFDEEMIFQILMKLTANAIHYSPAASEIWIEVGMQSDREKGSVFLCKISDQGEGIPKNELDQIFNKSVQRIKNKASAGASNISLSKCRDMLLAQGGTITAKNGLFKGAIFSFTLPFEKQSSFS